MKYLGKNLLPFQMSLTNKLAGTNQMLNNNAINTVNSPANDTANSKILKDKQIITYQ